VIEVTVGRSAQLQPLVAKLLAGLRSGHLAAVPVDRLMRDARTSA
jgi:hypothetical protein